MAQPLPASALALDSSNRVAPEDRPVHDWYRFVLSFPPHLVRHYLATFSLSKDDLVLDPFCGTGTTLVESKKLGVSSLGLEPNPVAHFASTVKTDWTVDPKQLEEEAEAIAARAARKLSRAGTPDDPLPLFSGPRDRTRKRPPKLRTLDEDRTRLLLKNAISPRPLHKALVLLEAIEEEASVKARGHHRLAFAHSVVHDASNLHFGPEVGLGRIKDDAPVVAPWLDSVRAMARDLDALRSRRRTPAKVLPVDARQLDRLDPASISAVITSPPYPNEKDYSRTTRLEMVLLDFVRTKAELREVKKRLVRSNTRGVYKEDADRSWITGIPSILALAESIEARRLELGKSSGFERMYHKVVLEYFGGMARHLAELRPALRPGARLAYVVGDQASYFRIMIRTGHLLAEIAERLGYTVDGIDVFRTRIATATRAQLREEVVLLRWKPGRRKGG